MFKASGSQSTDAMRQRYINTDLKLWSDQNIELLVEVLDERCVLLHGGRVEGGRWLVSAEAYGSGICDDPESTSERDISALLSVLESLEGECRTALEACTSLEFDIGWASSDQRPEGRIALSADLLRRIVAIGGTLAVTVYPSSENDAW